MTVKKSPGDLSLMYFDPSLNELCHLVEKGYNMSPLRLKHLPEQLPLELMNYSHLSGMKGYNLVTVRTLGAKGN